MTMTCDAPDCSRTAGHSGVHGHEVMPGMIVAPWSYSVRQRPELEGDKPISCNSCGSLLILHPEFTRAECSSCDQRISFDERGYSQTVLPKLYPSEMTDPKMLREFADHKVEQWLFFDTLRLRFGLIDESEFEVAKEKMNAERERFISEEVVPLESRRPWWATLLSFLESSHDK